MKTVVLDLDGTMYRGSQIIQSAKEFIDYYKGKWKKYRITKKQMEMAYKLLMK